MVILKSLAYFPMITGMIAVPRHYWDKPRYASQGVQIG